MEYLDSVLISPLLLFLNQYFNTFYDEHIVLWIAFVSFFSFLPGSKNMAKLD